MRRAPCAARRPRVQGGARAASPHRPDRSGTAASRLPDSRPPGSRCVTVGARRHETHRHVL
ncbi:hypothetical protein LUTEI9C_30195 [Luteimonas sp. 9C]|nr:hypothetical protein LUTEI9C_30195 [Luteimonas sp. 9C]